MLNYYYWCINRISINVVGWGEDSLQYMYTVCIYSICILYVFLLPIGDPSPVLMRQNVIIWMSNLCACYIIYMYMYVCLWYIVLYSCVVLITINRKYINMIIKINPRVRSSVSSLLDWAAVWQQPHVLFLFTFCESSTRRSLVAPLLAWRHGATPPGGTPPRKLFRCREKNGK